MNDPVEPGRSWSANGGAVRGEAAPSESARGFGHWLKRMFRRRNGGDALRDQLEEFLEKEDELDSPILVNERRLLSNVLNIGNLAVVDVMVPHADICAVEINASLPEVARMMSQNAHSRMPVYRARLDDAVGMVHIKDVLACWDDASAVQLESIVRPLLFVAPTMPVLELLLQMRVSRIHMALVVDEYGGIDGLLTIEDLVEEIVGEIQDEHDQESQPNLVANPDGSFDADARVLIEDFEARVGPFLTDEEREQDIDTLGGLVFYLAGRVPARGEILKHDSGIEFEVTEAELRRVRRLRILKAPSGGAAAGEPAGEAAGGGGDGR